MMAFQAASIHPFFHYRVAKPLAQHFFGGFMVFVVGVVHFDKA